MVLQTGYGWCMSKLQHRPRLRDAYRFRGFVPASTVRGVFGDSRVRLVTLRRSQKKQPAESAVDGIGASMIRSFAWCATWPVVSIASTWSYWCGG
jgi:hypothetical protein